MNENLVQDEEDGVWRGRSMCRSDLRLLRELKLANRGETNCCDKWWKLPPAPPKPDDKRSAFWRRLDTADALLLEHHRKVRELGERLDDPIGQIPGEPA